MCFIISCICVYYYDYLYVCYMLDIGERAVELMFSVYCHTDENKDYLHNLNHELFSICVTCIPHKTLCI